MGLGNAGKGAAAGAAAGSVVPGIGTVAGGLVGGALGLFDDSDKPAPPPPPKNGPQYGENYWGGQGYTYNNGVLVPGTSGADMDVNRYRSLGDAVDARGAYQLDYGRANNALDLSGQARDQQLAALANMRSAAMGTAPSRAELLGRNVLDQGFQQQLAGAAGARGGSLGQAAALRQAMAGGAAYSQQGANQLAAMRADEMNQARQAYMAGITGMRNQDFTNAQQAAAMAQSQGSLEMQQRQLNDQSRRYYEQLGWDTRNAAMGGAQKNQQLAQEAQAHRDQMNSDERQQNMQLASGIIQGVTTVGAHALADGGPMAAGQPYLVGERGPELVVPAKDGVVIPAEQTPDVMALYEPPGKQLHISNSGHAFFQDAPLAERDDGRPSLAGGAPTPAKAKLAQAAAMRAKAPAASRPLTPDELRAAADQLEREMIATHQARMAQGPVVSMGQAAYLMGGRESPY